MVVTVRRIRWTAMAIMLTSCARTSSLSLSLNRRQALGGVLAASTGRRAALATTAGGSPDMGATTMRSERAYNYQE